MSGDGGSRTRNVEQTTSTEPPEYAKPYLEDVLSEAKTEFESDRPSYYPGSTIADRSPQSELALQMTESAALGGSPLVGQAQDLAGATMRGDFLNAGNPYFQGAVDAATKPVISSVQSQFARGGRLGSGANQDVVARAVGDISSKMAYDNYARERAAQERAIGMVPGLREMDFADARKIAGVGAARDAEAQARLQADIDRFNFGQNVGRQKLGDYAALVRGGTFGGTQTNVTPQFYNPAANYLGLGLGAASLGSMLFGPPGGAAAGGLLRGLRF